MNRWKKKIDESWQKRWDGNGWHKEDDLSTELKVDYWDQYDDEYAEPVKAIRRAKRKELIEKALKECTILDLDAIYDNGTLFGRGFDYELGGHPRIFFEYAGDIYPIEIRFDFATNSIKFQITKFCAKIVDFVCVVKMVPFCMFYQKSKDLTRMMFDDVATQMIRELKKRLEEYD